CAARPPAPTAGGPAGVHPGGHGIFTPLELAWGRLRRALLRRFRPGYVAKKAAERQGDDPRFDIVDERDLKYVRNVCGVTFPGSDAVAKSPTALRLARYGLAEAVGFSAALALASALVAWLAALLTPWLALLLVPGLLLWAGVIWFFRDPERPVPADADALVSPADGVVTHVDEVDLPDFPGSRALRVGIFLSVFNVHVNRVPRSGRVVGLKYVP